MFYIQIYNIQKGTVYLHTSVHVQFEEKKKQKKSEQVSTKS